MQISLSQSVLTLITVEYSDSSFFLLLMPGAMKLLLTAERFWLTRLNSIPKLHATLPREQADKAHMAQDDKMA